MPRKARLTVDSPEKRRALLSDLREAIRAAAIGARPGEKPLTVWDKLREAAREFGETPGGRLLLLLLLFLSLSSFGTAPSIPEPDRVYLLRLPVFSSPTLQECTSELARQSGGIVLREVVSDPEGLPYGEVSAWRCSNDLGSSQEALEELKSRIATMEGEADAYRAAHPRRKP